MKMTWTRRMKLKGSRRNISASEAISFFCVIFIRESRDDDLGADSQKTSLSHQFTKCQSMRHQTVTG